MRILLMTSLALAAINLLAACGTKTPLTLPAPRLAPVPAAQTAVPAATDDNNNTPAGARR